MRQNRAHTRTQLLAALGSLVVEFSGLEDLLRDVIGLVSGRQRIVMILTSGLPFRTLVEKFGAVALECRDDFGSAEDIRQLCSALNQINDDRNSLIHSVWPDMDWPPGEYQRYKTSADSKKGLRFNVRAATVGEVENLRARIGEATSKLIELAVKSGPAA